MEVINKRFKIVYYLLGITFICVLGYSIYLFIIINRNGTATQEQNNLGVFLMGTCGIFISIASIIALILAFVTQQHIIYLQKSEIQSTSIRDSIIRLESKYFHLLEIFNNTVDGLEFVENNIAYHARDCFKIIYKKFVDEYNYNSDESDETSRINKAMAILNKTNGGLLRHYFIIAYHLISYINEWIYVEDDSKFYVNIFRAQLSSYEIILLKYNCISSFGSKKFKPLFEKYKLDEHIQERLLLNINHKNL